jgi:far upstream element-binding protein
MSVRFHYESPCTLAQETVKVRDNLSIQAYPGMAPQGYNPQNWGMPAYQQQWNTPTPGADAPAQTNTMQVNPSTGQPDYSLQWAEYYRSLGMHREAEMIEQQVGI